MLSRPDRRTRSSSLMVIRTGYILMNILLSALNSPSSCVCNNVIPSELKNSIVLSGSRMEEGPMFHIHLWLLVKHIG